MNFKTDVQINFSNFRQNWRFWLAGWLSANL